MNQKRISCALATSLLVVGVSSSSLRADGLQLNGFFKKIFDKTEAPKPISDEPEAMTSVPESVSEPKGISPQEAIGKVSQQKALLQGSREQKGQYAYDEGVVRYHQFKFAEALKMFQEAQLMLPEDKKVADYISKCRQILGASGDGVAQTSDWMGEQQDVVLQELKVKIKFHRGRSSEKLDRAKALWGEQQSVDAMSALEQARYEVRRAKSSAAQLPPGDNRASLLKEIEKDLSRIDDLQDVWVAQNEKRTKELARKKSLELSLQSNTYEKDRLEGLLSQARRLYLEGNYQETEDLCRVILDEWPKNRDAELIFGKSVRKKDRKLAKELKAKSNEEWLRNIEKIREASIAYAETVNYSKDWDKIESLRKSIARVKKEDPEWLRMMRQKMEKRVTLHLPDNTLSEAVDMMREQTGVNFIIDGTLELSDARVTELHLNDVRLLAALELILSNIPSDSPLVHQIRDEAVFITNRENENLFTRPVPVIYDVTDLVTSFGEYTLGEGEDLGQGLSQIDEASDSTSPLSTDTLIELMRESIEPESWDTDGILISPYSEGSIMIKHSEDVHDKISDFLDMFRKQQKLQVSIEARFITSSDDDLFDVGVEWKGLDEVALEDVATVGSGVYSDRSTTDFDSRVATVLGSAADDITGGSPSFIGENRSTQGLNAELTVLDPIRASIVLHALSRKRTTKDLIAPRLTVINNSQGYFLNTEEISYVDNFTSDQGNVVPEIERVSSGELLVVRPTVSSDRKYITLDLSPQVTRLVGLEEKNLQLPVRRDNGGGGGSSSTSEIVDVTIELPEVELWQLQTRVQVPDGGVVLVGGRMGNNERKSTRAVPILSKVPVLGRLFRSDGESVELENLVISVRAKILIFDELEGKLN